MSFLEINQIPQLSVMTLETKIETLPEPEQSFSTNEKQLPDLNFLFSEEQKKDEIVSKGEDTMLTDNGNKEIKEETLLSNKVEESQKFYFEKWG